MKQIIQNLKSGETILEEVPAPIIKKGHVLVKTTRSLVSLGTEKMLVEFGKANLIDKARQQPDKVKQVLDKIKSDGLTPTLEAVFNKLDTPLPLGYCNVGQVIGVGEGVKSFNMGDRVASNGNHAEIVSIPENLVAHIPEGVTDSEAVFTVIGSIGLQGIRLIEPTMGETFVVYGLGLIGLVTAQLLKANGCKVIGIDLDNEKCKLAESWGVITLNPAKGDDPIQATKAITKGVGVDGVIITASTKSNEIVHASAEMCRKRGRIILVGVVGLNLSRADFYEKELSFQVSCSYGPGRYDDEYEQHGKDYPLPYVRWTEKRNFETILEAIASNKLDVNPLITEEIDLADFSRIYGDMKASKSIASILRYSEDISVERVVEITKVPTINELAIGIIGAGNFTQMTVLPSFKKRIGHVKYIASASGLSGTSLAKKYGIPFSTSDYKEIINDKTVNLVIITTRHDKHAEVSLEALAANKNVFVEKPLALNLQDLEKIKESYQKNDGQIVVGYNRRFSPYIVKAKELLGDNPEPMNIVGTLNAGFIPQDVWVQDMKVGGGRIIGEACHYIDLMIFLTGSKVVSIVMNSLGVNPMENTDNATILLKFENGSQGTINYFANGSKAYSKERFEIFYQNKTLIMDNFKSLKGFGFNGFKSKKGTQDKGHKQQFESLIDSYLNSQEAIIPFNDLYNSTKASILAIESLKTGKWIEV